MFKNIYLYNLCQWPAWINFPCEAFYARAVRVNSSETHMLFIPDCGAFSDASMLQLRAVPARMLRFVLDPFQSHNRNPGNQ